MSTTVGYVNLQDSNKESKNTNNTNNTNKNINKNTNKNNNSIKNHNDKLSFTINYDYDYLYKILLIGDCGVGKSSILLKFTDDIFNKEHISTIGVDFKIKTFTYKNKKIKLQLWDTAGQERFQVITNSYYRGAQGIVVVFDLTNIQSFENIGMWLANASKLATQHCEYILVGNKSDLGSSNAVPWIEIANLVDKYDLTYVETSACNDSNIDAMFEKLVNKMMNNNLIKNTKTNKTKNANHDISINFNKHKNIQSKIRCCAN